MDKLDTLDFTLKYFDTNTQFNQSKAIRLNNHKNNSGLKFVNQSQHRCGIRLGKINKLPIRNRLAISIGHDFGQTGLQIINHNHALAWSAFDGTGQNVTNVTGGDGNKIGHIYMVQRTPPLGGVIDGGRCRIRTCDLTDVNGAL